ncbi:hypothetical protein [Massilibacteroides vaginae]|uniref:hypothetical protein n=1 Tax=Massilibacteroides vaginae TaxID=1673718 RepID=UPI000A1C8896|nr:hypothetical protein [Massilibacteroides vaginae]
MLRKDFILVQIEALGKAIAQLINNRKEGDPDKAEILLEDIYSSLHINKDYLLSHAPGDIRIALDGEDNAGIQRMEIAAKTLIEDSYIYKDKNALYKAQEILLYIQKHDLTFSIERMNLLDEIQDALLKQ